MWGGGWLFFYKSMGFIVLHGHEFFPGGFKNTEKAKYFVGGMGGFFLREGGKRRKGDSVICDFLGGGGLGCIGFGPIFLDTPIYVLYKSPRGGGELPPDRGLKHYGTPRE